MVPALGRADAAGSDGARPLIYRPAAIAATQSVAAALRESANVTEWIARVVSRRARAERAHSAMVEGGP